MSRDRREDTPRAALEPRSDFLRGQLRQWMEEVAAAGKTADLFELEMWLQSFERFFHIKNQPLSDKETKQLALRNWSEGLRLAENVPLPVVPLGPAYLPAEKVN